MSPEGVEHAPGTSFFGKLTNGARKIGTHILLGDKGQAHQDRDPYTGENIAIRAGGHVAKVAARVIGGPAPSRAKHLHSNAAATSNSEAVTEAASAAIAAEPPSRRKMAIDKQRSNGGYEKHAEMMKERDDANDRAAKLDQSHRAKHNTMTARKNNEAKKEINPELKELTAQHKEEVEPHNNTKNKLQPQLKIASKLRRRK